MLRGHFSHLSDYKNKKNIVSIILVGNAFVWYFSVLSTLEYLKPYSTVWIAHFSALILSALAGASLDRRLERKRFLILWMISGIVSSLTLSSIGISSDIILVLPVSLFLGVSLGFGMPACITYFSDSVAVEKRGGIGGIVMLASGLGMAALGLVPAYDPLVMGIILAVWRSSSLLVFLSVKSYRNTERKENVPSYRQVLGERSFILYFVPWMMFSLVNYLAAPFVPSAENFPGVRSIQIVLMGAAAFLGGFLVDSIGRKRIAIAAFTLLGIGSAMLTFSGNTQPSLLPYLNAGMDGIAWGFLLVLFIMTLWGDLSHNAASDKYYALGVMPFFLSKLLEITVGSFVASAIGPTTTLFSFAAFFLFLAILPLVYAPETLPEKIIKEHELKTYLEKAQKIAAKTQDNKEDTKESKESNVEFWVAEEDTEETERLPEESY